MGKVIVGSFFYWFVLQLFAAITMFCSGFDFELPAESGHTGYHFMYATLQVCLHIFTLVHYHESKEEYRLRN